MQGSHNRDGWIPFDDEELSTSNPPSRAGFEKAGQEAAMSYAKDEIDRLRAEVDEIAHAVEIGRFSKRKARALPVALVCAVLVGALYVFTRARQQPQLSDR